MNILRYLLKHQLFKYLVYLFVVLIYFYFYFKISVPLISEGRSGTPLLAINSGLFKNYLLLRIINILTGILVALPYIVNTILKRGKLKFNLSRFIILCIPSIIISSGILYDLRISFIG